MSIIKRIQNLLQLSKYHITPCSVRCPVCGECICHTGVFCSEKEDLLYVDAVAFHKALVIRTLDPCDECKSKASSPVV